jgi:membrane protein YqaA with SNARE-associated domain
MTGCPMPSEPAPRPGDRVSVLRWILFYMGYLAAAMLVLLLMVDPASVAASSGVVEAMDKMSPAAKLLAFAIYISLCCTFLPLPTGAVVAAVATRQAGISDSLVVTTLLVATVGAVASTIANLHDYHLLTWMLRSRRVAKVRDTGLYHASSEWFSRSPFFLVVVFNFLPIPVDVVRILATTYRYPRLPFAAANLVGRFVRYAVIAGCTFALSSWREDAGLIAVLALLALAVAMGLVRVSPRAIRWISRKLANVFASGVSKR